MMDAATVHAAFIQSVQEEAFRRQAELDLAEQQRKDAEHEAWWADPIVRRRQAIIINALAYCHRIQQMAVIMPQIEAMWAAAFHWPDEEAKMAELFIAVVLWRAGAEKPQIREWFDAHAWLKPSRGRRL